MSLDSQMFLSGPGGGRAQPPATFWEVPFPAGAMGTDLIVVGAVGGLLHRRVLLVVAHLYAHHGVHVQAHQLPGLDHRDADLQAREREAGGWGRKRCEPWSWVSRNQASFQLNGWSPQEDRVCMMLKIVSVDSLELAL